MWDKKYGGADYFYGTEPNGFLRNNVAALPKGRVLCLADGEGRNSVFLAEQGYDVTAIDQSIEGIKKGRRLAAERGVNVDYIHGDLADFDIGQDRWSAVVSIFCHLPQPLRSDVHKRVVQALKPGGVFLAELYHPDQLAYKTGGPPVESLLVRPSDLKRELAPLEFNHLAEVERDIVEGTGHRGLGAVTQAIAVKSS